MPESLHIEISASGPNEWRVVERSRFAAENIARIAFQRNELDDIVLEIGQCLLDANVTQEAQRTRLHRLGERLAEIILPPPLRRKVAASSVPVEFFLDEKSVLLPVELFPHGATVLAEALPVSRHWFCENALPPSPRQSTAAKQALIIADPAENLPGAQKEGEELFRKLRSLGKTWHCRYLGRAVTVAELSKELPQTDLLHLAGHYVSGDTVESSGVIMADGLWLPPQSSHTPELAFINCCRAGLTADGNGDLSLVGRLLRQGSRHVVAPYLPVSDQTAKLFADSFYQSLFAGKDVGEAVWEARKRIGPAGWGYWHFGSFPPTPSEKRSGTGSLLAIAGCLLAIGIALLFYLKHPPVDAEIRTPHKAITTDDQSGSRNGTIIREQPDHGKLSTRINDDAQGPSERIREKLDYLDWENERLHQEMSALHNKETKTAILFRRAAETGDISTLDLLVKNGWPIDQEDMQGFRVFKHALFAGQIKVLEWLKQHGADIKSLDDRGSSPIIAAADLGNIDVLQWLYDNEADVNQIAPNGGTVMHIAAMNNNTAVMQWLYDRGAYLEAKTTDGKTPFMLARENGNIKAAAWLENKFNTTTIQERNNLYKKASDRARLIWLKKLFDKGEPEAWSEYRKKAAMVGDIPSLEHILNSGSGDLLDAADKMRMRTMHYALLSGQLKTMEWLYQHGAKIDRLEEGSGWGYVFLAAFSGNVEALQWLHSHGVDIHTVEPDGANAMHVAAVNNQVDAMQWLYDNGVDIEAKTNDGETPFDWAREKKHTAALEWLENKLNH